MIDQKPEIIKAVVFSIFDDDGPTPKIYWPRDMEESARLLIAMKTISILMGDAIYQDGSSTSEISYFGILPFPDLKLNGLTYFFLIPDSQARGNAKASTITILIDESNRVFFYENMKYLRIIIDKAASKIQETKDFTEYEMIMLHLKEELIEFTKDLEDPLSTKRQLKILFTGIDGAGKTSFLLVVKKRYSEIIKVLPTKGVSRSNEQIFEQQNSQISIWDLAGQKTYRDKFIEESKRNLYNIDLMFYFIDIQDEERITESLKLYKEIIYNLKELNEFPSIIICLNKHDPDLKDTKPMKKRIKNVTIGIEKQSEGFFFKVFNTSIFDHWSLISAYSFGLSQLSPNRELFVNQLKQFAKNTKADAILLLNDNGIILSSYSNSEISETVFEISAPHYQTLYKTFKEFKLLKKDYLISSGITDDSKSVIFKRIIVDQYNLYLLLYVEEEQGIKNVEKNLTDFVKNIKDLIKTYI